MALEFFQQLDDLIVSQVKDSKEASSVLTSLGVPSASIAILTSSGIIHHTIANELSPADASTLYQACSISKPVCGLAVLRTVDQRRLAIDDPITQHLPSAYVEAISTPSTRPLLEHVTIQHLLTHTAGTTVSGFPGYDPTSSIPSLHTILSGATGSNTPQIRLNRFPGLKWRYSGGGFTILQATLESIHNKPFSEIMKELVFEPLGMTRSCYSLVDDESNYAQCWDTGISETKPARWHVQPESGAAGLWTTPTDLLKAVSGIRDAAEGRSAFLSRELALMGLKTVEGAGGFTGAGWQIEKGWVGHGGSNNPGFRCQVMAIWDGGQQEQRLGKAKGEGVAIMTNSAMGTEVCCRLLQAIAYLRGWPGREVLAVPSEDDIAIPLADAKVEVNDVWKAWKGTWRLVVDENNDSIRKNVSLEVVEDEQGRPTVKMAQMPPMKVFQAAIPAVKSGAKGRTGVDLVVEGLDMMLALGDNEAGDESLEIWPGFFEGPLSCGRV